jgi:hypothetical protein
MNKFDKYLNMINENYKVIFKEIKPKNQNDENKLSFVTKENIDIFFYTKNENNSLKNEGSIQIKQKTKISESPRVGLNRFLKRKIKAQIISKCEYIHIFIGDVDHYGLLHVDDKNKFIEKIVNTLITGIPMFKNK